MKTVAFLNVKGGVGKTTSSIAFAYILSQHFKKRVLLIDLDKQANSTAALHNVNIDKPSVSDLLVNKDADLSKIISKTRYNGLDIIPANMRLMKANQEVLLDVTRPQQLRIKKYVDTVKDNYDFCIIDCPTDINMATINALAFTDDVIIPIKIDNYSFDGLSYVIEAVTDMQDFNPKLNISGCFATMYQNNNLNKQGTEMMKNSFGIHCYGTVIRQTVKVQESTYIKPLLEYDKNCTASLDYISLVDEYLKGRC